MICVGGLELPDTVPPLPNIVRFFLSDVLELLEGATLLNLSLLALTVTCVSF